MREPPSPLRIAFLTHEPFYPPSGGGSAEAVYLVQEMVRRGHEVHVFGPRIPDAEGVEKKFHVTLHPFTRWEMGRYAKLRNFKYLAYPFFLERMVAAAARGNTIRPAALATRHFRRGRRQIETQLGVPVVMNFPDLLTGFMETWPGYVAPRPLVRALMRYEMSLPMRYDVDGVCAISDEFADRLAARGYPREKIRPIYYGYDAQAFPLRGQLPPPGQPPVVVMHGSFDAHHLRRIAFDAVKLVVAKKPETIFRFVGRRTAGLEKFLHRAQVIPNFKFDAPGFTPYAEVSKQLANATVGIVPYEESAGTHCAFVAKIVEYVATGLPTVCTPLKSVQSYFKSIRWCDFPKFNGEDLGRKNCQLAGRIGPQWQPHAAQSAAARQGGTQLAAAVPQGG